jgi:hypothetical protein
VVIWNARKSLTELKDIGKRLEEFRGEHTNAERLMGRVLNIRDKQGRLVPMIPNRAQREFARTCGRKNIILKARQLGMTTYVAARFFLRTITTPGTLSVQVAHDQRSAEEIFRIVHRFLENLPEELRNGGALETSRANVRQVVFPRLDSEYRVETAADPNAGRGLTIQNLHCSEVARWPRNAEETLASLRAAVPPCGEIVLESTPRGSGGAFYDEWQRAGVTGYVRHFYPWWWEPQYRRNDAAVEQLTAEERDLMRAHGLTLAQIAFRRETRSNFGVRAVEEFAEDAETCFRASGECVFDLETVEARMRERPDPIESRDNGRLQVWWPALRGSREYCSGEPNGRGRRYIIGVDPAGGGTDGDYACAQVIERSTGMQCAELHGHFTPRDLAVQVLALSKEYDDALIAVERNNHGHAVLAHLLNDGRENIYRSNRQAGWLTTAASRPRMIENLGAVLTAAPELFSSVRLLQECRTFVRQSDGTTGAMSGTHDDAVMAMAVALAVRAETAGEMKREFAMATL